MFKTQIPKHFDTDLRKMAIKSHKCLLTMHTTGSQKNINIRLSNRLWHKSFPNNRRKNRTYRNVQPTKSLKHKLQVTPLR